MHLPKVSVSLITYNQEKYIAECLDSILKQQTNFSFEIVVSDDCSTDKTGSIVEGYAARHPEQVRYIKRVKNLGMVPNAISTISECKGEYIALMEGDDIWMDHEKLQLQADFLDSNKDCVICFTNQFAFYEDGDSTNKVYYNSETRPPDKFDLDFLFQHNPVIPNNSKMFRRDAQPSHFPDWFFTSLQWDWVLHILQGRNGKFGYLDRVTLGYRRHANAAVLNTNYTALALSGLNTLKHLNAYLDYKYDFFCSRTSWHYSLLAYSYLEKKMPFKFLYYYLIHFIKIKSLSEFNIKIELWKLKQIMMGRKWA